MQLSVLVVNAVPCSSMGVNSNRLTGGSSMCVVYVAFHGPQELIAFCNCAIDSVVHMCGQRTLLSCCRVAYAVAQQLLVLTAQQLLVLTVGCGLMAILRVQSS
jgi:hypothetical protein